MAVLATPVVTIFDHTNATVAGGSNATISISWPPVTNAGAYTVGLAAGTGATTGFYTVDTDATSPYTLTGLQAGAWTVGVMARP